MKALTIRQPWASLIAHGVKTIETRSWRTNYYRGPLAIHAGKASARDGFIGDHLIVGGHMGPKRVPWTDKHLVDALPLGAIVATARLVDCLPIVEGADEDGEWSERADDLPDRFVSIEMGTRLVLWEPDLKWHGAGSSHFGRTISDQLPYGDFTPGRWAWLLDDVKPTTERCPACWGTRIVEGTGWGDDLANDAEPCPHCWVDAARFIPAGKCDPIPAKGRQGLWEWTP